MTERTLNELNAFGGPSWMLTGRIGQERSYSQLAESYPSKLLSNPGGIQAASGAFAEHYPGEAVGFVAGDLHLPATIH
jgi:hypothetical protein